MRQDITHNTESYKRFQKHLIIACDIIMLNALVLVLISVIKYTSPILMGLLILNCIAIIVLRLWLCHFLEIPWLLSPFNRVLKRLSDIVSSILFLLFVFPFIYILQTISIKKAKQGPVLILCNVQATGDKTFTALCFNNNNFFNRFYLGYTPLCFSILLGKISIWDLRLIQEITPEPQQGYVSSDSCQADSEPHTIDTIDMAEGTNIETHEQTNNTIIDHEQTEQEFQYTSNNNEHI